MQQRMPMMNMLLLVGLCMGPQHARVSLAAPSLTAGDPALRMWLLPDKPPEPTDNLSTPARVKLGKMLYFDPRLSGDKNMSCATCHNPSLGWSDGLSKARGVQSKLLNRASPTIANSGYNTIQMWDGRKATLEDQAIGPLENPDEMNSPFPATIDWLKSIDGYRKLFAAAYPGEAISKTTLAKAIAVYERTIISNDSPFDHWIKGDTKAMTTNQVRGFELFLQKCALCHQPPNFTDDGFHNIGIKTSADQKQDIGRFAERPVKLMRGAFKTPTIREVTRTAPYFHDGSAATLMAVVEHYDRGGDDKSNLSPSMLGRLKLSDQDKQDLVDFMQALSSPAIATTAPDLPQ